MGVKDKCILSLVKTVGKWRSVLDDNMYVPGIRPYWAPSRTQFWNLIMALSTEPDMNTSKQILLLYHRLMT
jgi:hypothetical protein